MSFRLLLCAALAAAVAPPSVAQMQGADLANTRLTGAKWLVDMTERRREQASTLPRLVYFVAAQVRAHGIGAV